MYCIAEQALSQGDGVPYLPLYVAVPELLQWFYYYAPAEWTVELLLAQWNAPPNLAETSPEGSLGSWPSGWGSWMVSFPQRKGGKDGIVSAKAPKQYQCLPVLHFSRNEGKRVL